MRSRLAFYAAAVLAAVSIIPTGLDDDGGAVLVAVAAVYALGAFGRPTQTAGLLQLVLGGLFFVAVEASLPSGLASALFFAAFANSAFAIGRRFLGRASALQQAQ